MLQGSKGTATYGVTIDTQWSSLSRTRLRVDMTEAKFNALHTSFLAMEKEYRSTFRSTIAGVLSHLPWLDNSMVEMYIDAGRLAQVFNSALSNYHQLMDFIEKVGRDISWAYAAVILNHYALKLQVICNGSTKRFTMILRTYVLLREGAAVEWKNLSVQGKIMK